MQRPPTLRAGASTPSAGPDALGEPRAIALNQQRLAVVHQAAAQRASTRAERQGHGFLFERAVAAMLGLFMAQSYTSAMDCFSADPSTYPYATSWVIKTANIMAEIDFGSLARNAMMTDDFHLVLADWTGRRTNFVRVYVMRVTAAYWRGLFPIDVTPFLAGSVFEGISNMHADDEVWKRRRKALQEQWQAHLPEGSPMKVRFKRDHKIQRRVQCAMSREGFHRLFAATFDAAKTTELELALDH